MDITYRKASEADCELILNILKKCFKKIFETYGYSPSYQSTPDDIRSALDRAEYYIFEQEGKAVGLTSVKNLGEHRYELERVAILPEFQSRGLGQKMLKAVEKIYEGAISFILETPDREYRNHHFYEKLGYVKIDERFNSEHNQRVFIYYKEP